MNRAKLINSLVDDVLDGEVLKFGPRELSAFKLIDDSGVEMWVAPDDLAILLTGNDEAVERVQRRIRPLIAMKARAWLEANPDYVTERLQEIEEDERAEAAERRAEARVA